MIPPQRTTFTGKSWSRRKAWNSLSLLYYFTTNHVYFPMLQLPDTKKYTHLFCKIDNRDKKLGIYICLAIYHYGRSFHAITTPCVWLCNRVCVHSCVCVCVVHPTIICFVYNFFFLYIIAVHAILLVVR